MSVEEAVRKMTSISAPRFGLSQRGVIAKDAFADLLVFDDGAIADTATFEDPRRYPVGLDEIYVNGRLAAQGGTPSQERAGRLIRHGCACCAPQPALACN